MRSFYFAGFAAIGIHAPYFPLWLEAHGFRGVSMSLIAALSPALSAVAPPLIGALSDARGGRGSLLSVVCGLAALAMSALALAEASGVARTFVVVFACVFVYASCRAPIILLADRIALESSGDYGRRRLWGSVGFLLGALGFGHLCPPEYARWLPGAVALALWSAFCVSLRLPRASRAPARGHLTGALRRLGRQPRMVFLLLGSSSFSFSHASYDLCGSLAFRDLGASSHTIGLLWATGVVAEVLLLARATQLLQAVPAERLLVASYAIGALRWLGMSALPSAEIGFLLQPLHGVSFGLVWISSLEVLRRASGPSALGGAQGVFMAANSAGGTLGILTFGPLYAASGATGVYQLAALAACGAVLLSSLAVVRRASTSAA